MEKEFVYLVYGELPRRSNQTICVSGELFETQKDNFRKAGYHRVIIKEVPAMITKDRRHAFLIDDERIVEIAKEAVPIESINGIGLRKYERKVLKRPRMTSTESFVAAIVALLLFSAPLVAIIIGAVQEMIRPSNLIAMPYVLVVISIGYVIFAPRWMKFSMRKGEEFAGIPSVDEWYAD